jgi:cytochrome b561
MNGPSDSVLRYDPLTIRLHWAVAALVAFQWLGAHAIDWFPKGPMRIDARSVHILTGACLAGVLAFRLYWRASQGRRLPPANHGLLDIAARGLHALLYVAVGGVLGLGLFLAWLRGDSLFNLVQLPKFGDFAPAARHAFAEQITDLHGLGANLILALAAAHALAALVHHYVAKDGVLRRMLPQ